MAKKTYGFIGAAVGIAVVKIAEKIYQAVKTLRREDEKLAELRSDIDAIKLKLEMDARAEEFRL